MIQFHVADTSSQLHRNSNDVAVQAASCPPPSSYLRQTSRRSWRRETKGGGGTTRRISDLQHLSPSSVGGKKTMQLMFIAYLAAEVEGKEENEEDYSRVTRKYYYCSSSVRGMR